MKKFPMTIEGAARLKSELQRLKTVDRPTVIQAIAEARAHGDLSENADYERPRSGRASSRAASREIEHKLASAQVIDPSRTLDADGQRRVRRDGRARGRGHGRRVSTYQIVGDDEADLKHGKISISSPIARALIGKAEGDIAEVQAPGGVREYEILAVRYA